MSQTINNSSDKIQVRDLQLVTRSVFITSGKGFQSDALGILQAFLLAALYNYAYVM